MVMTMGKSKYQCVLQLDESDCGAATLATVSKFYGRAIAINRIREAVGTGQEGTTLLGLRRGAELLGFNAQAVRVPSKIFDKINEIPLPAIIHWKGYHYVVFWGQQGKHYVIADPAVGIRHLSKQELLTGWTNGIILLLTPDSTRFFAQPNDNIGGLARFFKRVLPYRSILIPASLCALFTGLLSLSLPFLIQLLTDDVLVRGDTKLLSATIVAVVVMNLFSSGLQLAQSNLIAHFTQRLELGLILEFGRQILRLPLNYYETRRSGEVVSRLTDIQEVNQLVSQVVVSLPSQFFVAVVSLSLMLIYSWKLTLAAVLIAVLMTLSTVIFLPTLQQKTRSLLVLDAENQGVLVETFKGALTLKTTTAGSAFWQEFQSRFSRLATLTLRTIQISIANSIFSGLVSQLGAVVLLSLGSSLVIGKQLTIGQLMAFNSMNENFLAFIAMIIGLVDEMARIKTATQRLSEVIDATPETQGDAQKSFTKIPTDASITCTNLNFHHTGRVALLEDFSMQMPGGKLIALVGKSGCGKSTLAKLLAGLYPLSSGNIRFGLYNLQDLPLDCLRQQVVLVPQEPHFWSRSIIENFHLGDRPVTFENIIRACQIADADSFISKLPDKYQTILGEFGANLSGGQRQRLAIARAIVTEPPILILDESTSGLDTESEAQVLDYLLAHRRGKTTILISHRPHVIDRADWVIVLEAGRLKIAGSPEDLRIRETATSNSFSASQNFL
jgi:ATP-binding cassette subfamily C protein